MKNIFLTVILISFSFSFAKQPTDLKYVKKNVPLVVDYLAQNLKLNSKQKTVMMNAFSEYANSIIISRTKLERKISSDVKKSTKVDSPRKPKEAYVITEMKHMRPYVLRFTEKRNTMISEVLRGKQKKQFNDLQKSINPMTLEINNIKEENKTKN
tara:strand:- start:101 stop:565 length:465 start_codon:yes stop_codon:yes gene_type:complete